MNMHQPNKKLLTIRRGEGGEERQGGPLWSPASWSLCSPDGLCQPNGGRCVLHPVGTRGGGALCLSWWGGDRLASRNPDHSSGHQDKHKAPTLLHVHPLSLQDGGRHSQSFPDSVGNNHNRRCARSSDTRSAPLR